MIFCTFFLLVLFFCNFFTVKMNTITIWSNVIILAIDDEDETATEDISFEIGSDATYQCKTNNGRTSCSCANGLVGTPPNCKLKCISRMDCAEYEKCINGECVNICPSNTCGTNAECIILFRNVICMCRDGFTRDTHKICNPLTNWK